MSSSVLAARLDANAESVTPANSPVALTLKPAGGSRAGGNTIGGACESGIVGQTPGSYRIKRSAYETFQPAPVSPSMRRSKAAAARLATILPLLRHSRWVS